MVSVVSGMTSGPQNGFERYSIGGLYRLLNKVSDSGLTANALGPTFGHSRMQAVKYIKLALGLGLVIGDVHEREFTDRRRKRFGPWDRYYHTTPKGEQVLRRFKEYAGGKRVRRYPDPPLLRGSTRRNPRFPDRR